MRDNASADTVLSRGAGAILHTDLAKLGYHLPVRYALTEEEQHRAYEIEVRLRLGQIDSAPAMLDLLVDLPAEGLLSLSGLLEAALDLLGGLRLEDASPALPHCRPSPELGLRWCTALLRSLRRSFAGTLDGSLCSATPSFALAADDRGPSAAMARTLMLQRHPSIDPLSSEAAVYPSTSVSMTGFAFSCCAAALPLLMRSTDPALLLGVATLLKEAVPLMSEPSLGRLNGDALTHACDHEVRRFQHLLNRLEQIFQFFGDAPSLAWYSNQGEPSPYDLAATVFAMDLIEEVPPSLLGDGLEVGPLTRGLLTRLCLVPESKLRPRSRALFDSAVRSVDKDAADRVLQLRQVLASTYAFLDATHSSLASLDSSLSLAHSALSFVELAVTSDSQTSLSKQNLCAAVCIHSTQLFVMASGAADGPSATSADHLLIRVLLCNSACSKAALAVLSSSLGSASQATPSSLPSAHTDTSALIRRLATPLFLSTFLHAFLPPLNTRDDFEELNEYLVNVFSAIAVYSLESNLFATNSEEWASCFLPLKIVVLTLANSESALHRLLSHLCSMLEEAFVAVSALHSTLLKGSMLGLLSHKPEMRSLAVKYLRKTLVKGDTMDGDYDPVSSKSGLRVVKLASYGASKDNAYNVSSTSVFTHAELRKLDSIAFGNFESSLQLISLRMLHVRLQNDRQLLATADSQWVLRVVASCMALLSSVDWSLPNPLDSVNLEFLLECISLVEFLVLADIRVRKEFCLSGSSDHLRILVLPLLHESSDVRKRNSSVHIDVLLAVIGRILTNCLLCSENFEYYVPDNFIGRATELYTTQDSDVTSRAVCIIPDYLSNCFGAINLSAGHIAHGDSTLTEIINAPQSIVCSRAIRSSLLPRSLCEYLDFVFENQVTSATEDRLSTLVISKVSAASGHKAFRASLYTIRLHVMCVAHEAVSYISQLKVLLQVLAVPVKDAKDLNTLTVALMTLGDILIAAKGSKDDAMLMTYKDIAKLFFTFVSPTLSPGFRIASSSSDSLTLVYSDLHFAVVAFLSRFCSLLFGGFRSEFFNELARSSIANDVAKLITNELSPSYLRSAAAGLLQTMLAKCPAVWKSLCDPSRLVQYAAQSSRRLTTLDELLHVASLRISDSSLRLSVVLECLKLLAIGGELDSEFIGRREWTFLIRLAHDRRSTVRFASLRLYECLLSRCKAEKIDYTSLMSVDSETSTSPFDSIRSIASDKYECALLRLMTCRIQVMYADLSDLRGVLTCLCTLIDPEECGVSFSIACLPSVLDLLFQIISSHADAETLLLVKQLKIIPRTVAFLRQESETSLQSTSLSRIAITGSTSSCTIENGSTTEQDMRWGSFWSTHIRTSVTRNVALIASACKLLHLLMTVDESFGHMALVHSDLLVESMHCLVRLQAIATREEVIAVTSISNLISTVLIRSYASEERNSNRVSHSSIAVGSGRATDGREYNADLFIDARLAIGVSGALTASLHNAVSIVTLPSFKMTPHASELITALLRLLAIITQLRQTRCGLAVADANKCLISLVEIRLAISDTTSTNVRILLHRIDISVCFVMSFIHRYVSVGGGTSVSVSSSNQVSKYLKLIMKELHIYAFNQDKSDRPTDALSLLKGKLKSPRPSKAVSPQTVVAEVPESKWRAKTRGYEVSDGFRMSNPGKSNVNLSAISLLAVHASLLVVQHASYDSSADIRQLFCEEGLSEILGFILRLSSSWSSKAKQNEEMSMNHSHDVPMHRQLVVAALAALSSSLGDLNNLQVLSGMSSTKVVMHSSSKAKIGASISQLLTLGMSKDADESTRCLALSVAARALAFNSSVFPYNSLADAINADMRRLLSSSSSSQSLLFLLQIYFASFECTDSSQKFYFMPFSELLKWVRENYADNDEVIAIILRGVGRSATLKAATKAKSAVSSEDSIDLLCSCMDGVRSASYLAKLATVTLWALVHSSEQVAGTIKAGRQYERIVSFIEQCASEYVFEDVADSTTLDVAFNSAVLALQQTFCVSN